MKDYSTVYSIQYTGTSCYTRTYCRLRLIVCIYAGYTCVQYLPYIPTNIPVYIYKYCTVYTGIYSIYSTYFTDSVQYVRGVLYLYTVYYTVQELYP